MVKSAASPGSSLALKYQLEHLIGRGGGGKVYQARQRSTGQLVAVKLLELDRELSLRALSRRKDRFRREMKICGRLDHPDVVGLIDYGEHEDSLYSVFELVPGRTVAQRLRTEGALPVGHATALARQVLDVLIHAHAHGVIHRDLKPSNLMIFAEDTHPRIKVLDFGVSAIPSGSSTSTLTRLTLSNEMVGTPAYAAPEQLRGDAPTSKTDLYAWGLLLLECLTGVCPMTGASLGEIFQKQLSPAPVPIAAGIRAHELGTVLRWVLEKNPARRARSAAEVLARFDEIDPAGLADATGYFVERTVPPPSAGGRASRAVPDQPVTETGRAVRIRGERRPVTALCCRVQLECTAPVETALLDAYRNDLFSLCAHTVEEFGGAPISGFGDLALYCFGIPRARDIDARMAARAALELSSRIRARAVALAAQSRIRLFVRVGLHTGLITALGRTPGDVFAHGNVASRALALALRGGDDDAVIAASDEFRRLAARHAEFSKPIDATGAYLLTGESLTDVFARGAAPMVGRDDELASLLDMWRDTSERARVALVIGEAGIGKSRLAHEFRRIASEEGHGYLGLRCLPEMAHLALGPLLDLVRAELGFEPEREPRCEDLVSALDSLPRISLTSAVPLMSAWMSIPLEEPYRALPYSPQKQRAMLHELLTDLTEIWLVQRSGYLLIEDLHWADPSTCHWLGHLFRRLADRGCFVLMTARPEFTMPWDDLEPRLIELTSLDRAQVARMIAGLFEEEAPSELTGERAMAPLVEQIVMRADGVPLFVEELARTFFDYLADNRSDSQVPETLPEVPATLRALMLSRLDALGSAKETAQFAAALGREFDLPLLLASRIDQDEATLRSDLDQLISAGIVLGWRRVDGHRYIFRHTLLLDAAYESLTSSGRQVVHDAIATSLLQEFSGRVQARPDVAALHLERAERFFESQEFWLSAGRKAMQDLAYTDAQVHLRRGLEVLTHCPPETDTGLAELDLLNALSAAYIARFGYGANELVDIFGRAGELLRDSPGFSERELPSYWGQFLFNAVRPNFARAYPIAKELLVKAERLDAPSFVLQAHSAKVRAEFWMGEFVAAVASGESCESTHDRQRDKALIAISGEDPYLAAISFAATAELVLGRLDGGIARHQRVLALARDYGTHSVIASMWTQMAWIHIFRGLAHPAGRDLELACRNARESSAYSSELGFPFWDIQGQLMLSAARVYQGDVESIAGLESAMQMYLAIGADIGFSWFFGCIAHGQLAQGRHEEAAAALAKARAHMERSDERFFTAELGRLEARLLAARGQSEAAVTRLCGALTDARGRHARLWELHVIGDLMGHESLLGAEQRRMLAETATFWRTNTEGLDLDLVQRIREWSG